MKMSREEKLLVNSRMQILWERLFVLPLMKRMAKPRPGGDFLELGCGQGAGVEFLFEYFGAGRVVAVDVDREQVELAGRRLHDRYTDRLDLRVGDAADLGDPPHEFDAVFSFNVLHHIEAWRNAIAEAARVLKPGGVFYLCDPYTVFYQMVNKYFGHPEEAAFTRRDLFAAINRTPLRLKDYIEIPGIFFILAAEKSL